MSNIKDVAKRANVSTATVSRVLANNYPVSKKTRKKVLKAVKELDYHPNVSARSLRKKETKTIVVLLNDFSNPYFSEIVKGIEDVAIDKGYYILIGTTENLVEREKNYINLLKQQGADGVIFLTTLSKPSIYRDLAKEKPVIFASANLGHVNIPTVSVDYINSAKKIVQHLINLGHEDIGIITGHLQSNISMNRLEGYKNALRQNNIRINEELIIEGDFKIEGGYRATIKLLKMKKRPSAIFASNDEMAVGAIRAVKSMGIKVPNDIAIAGFDNIPLASLVEPKITTIHQPRFDIGKISMQLMVDILNGRKVDKYEIILEDKLVIRESCGAYFRTK